MKRTKILAFILSLLMLNLCGCNSSDSRNLQQTDDTEQETIIIITEGNQDITSPEVTSNPAETASAATDTETLSESSAAVTTPASTTVLTAANPAQTTAAATQKPAETTVPKPAETTAATTPPQTTVETAAEPAANQPLNGSILHNYTQKWFFNQITDKQKTAYERIYNGIANKQEKISVSDLDMNLEDLKTACFSYEKDNPGFINTYWEYSAEYYGTEANADVQTIVAVYDSSADGTRLKTAADNVLAEAKKLPNDYQRLKYVHDWISENTVYNDSSKYHTKRADGPILYGEAICSGYSKALMYFAQELGIPCICIEGRTREDHMWNMVKLDGNWYHVDMTYDDPNTASGTNALRYDYFLVSDSTIKKDHTIDKQVAIPSAPKDY